MQSAVVLDPSQEGAQLLFTEVAKRLEIEWQKKQKFIYKNLYNLSWLKLKSVPGIYLWGGVGRGKTLLMDIFYKNLPFKAKQRLHFHSFMRYIHNELQQQQLERATDPLRQIAQRFVHTTQVLCLDEFFVDEITDAMILARLLNYLFAEGLTLITTSNLHPDDLYKNGFQRQQFLPAIDLLKQHTVVFHLDNNIDYRLRVLTQAPIYHFPLDVNSAEILKNNFMELTSEKIQSAKELIIEHRILPVIAEENGVLWCDFKILCQQARSQNDYLEIAKLYHTVLLSNVLQFTQDDVARRFINMIDIFYDCRVKLIISAESPITDLYLGETLRFEFQRTQSRLYEMQSNAYLAEPHFS